MAAPSSITTLVGRTLGEFVLSEKIGEGGFAAVYRAVQPALERDAVVKVLHARLAKRPDVIQRFLRESRLASRLDHPYAAHVYAFGAEQDGTLWIAMELVRGTPMDKLLAEQGPISIERFVPLFERICEVVQTAHERGIVHRDLKPANVMVLSRAGRLLPKLLDFGIARVAEEAHAPAQDEPAVAAGPRETRAGAMMGSPSYMAPEQWADAGSAGKPADIYALGVLAFEALTGRHPYDASTVPELMTAHAKAAPRPLGDGLEALDPVIARALAKRPEERFDTAGDFAAAIRGATSKDEVEILPQLDEPLRVAMAAGAPQPIAEALAALEAARNIDQACALLGDVQALLARWLGILALACRTKVGAGGPTDSHDAVDRLRALRGDVDDRGWLDLALALTRPFARHRDAYPVPELVGLFHVDEGDAPFMRAFEELATARKQLDRRAGKRDDERRDLYADALAALAATLRPLRFLLDYTVIVTRRKRAERWSGLRRSPRLPFIRRARPLPDDVPYLLDADGHAALALVPLVQARTPAPGKDEELFVFAGHTPLGGRLIAMPFGFELHDASLEDWFREHLLDLASDTSETVADELAPYRGLAAFTADDASLYFGREREVDTGVNRLRVEPFLAVVGPSGAGKSSFVQAGVIPRLPTSWRAIVVRPGPSPAAALEARLERSAIDAAGLRDDPRALGDRLRAAAAREGSTIVLVVDQLEELFTLCRDAEERARYAEAIASASRSDDDPVRVVVTLRDDFLIRAESEPALRERFARGIKLLATPASEDLARILVEPARRAGYQFEERTLVTEMVDAVAGKPGALALLSFTAAELWKLRDRHFRQLGRKAYAAIGGVGGALARHAEVTLEALPSHEQQLVREAFRHLVTAEGTRQVLQAGELRQLLAPDDVKRADAVIDKLVAARLLVVSEEAGDDDRIEIIHEALLAAWPRLVEWRREDSEGARLRDQLRTAAKQWESRGRPRGLLWRDEALAEYQIWRTRYPGALTIVESDFGSASVADATRGRRIRRTAIGTAFALLSIALFVMFQLQKRAETQRQLVRAQLVESYEDRGRQALLAGNYPEALAYLDGVRRMTGSTRPALDFMIARARAPFAAELATLRGHEGQLWAVAFSPDGKWIATSGQSDGTARLWDPDGAQVAVLAHAPGRVRMEWSPDGRLLATTDALGALRLWNDRGGLVAQLASEGAMVPAFSRDGQRLAGAGLTMRIWDVTTRSITASWEVDTLPVGAAFDGSGRLLTIGGEPRLWSVDGVVVARAPKRRHWYVQLDRRGTRAVLSGPDGARVWNLDDDSVRELVGHDGMVSYAAFAPDGRVVTGGADRTIRFWDATGLTSTLHGHTGQINRVCFNARGELASVAADSTARLWDARGVQIATYQANGMAYDCAFDPAGERLATASWNGTARLWDVRVRARLAAVPSPKADLPAPAVDGLAAVLDGDTLVRLQDDATAWRIADRAARPLPVAKAVAVAAHDGTIVVADAGGVLHIFEGGREVREVRAISANTSVRTLLLHDGRIVALGADRLIAWELASGRELARSATIPALAQPDKEPPDIEHTITTRRYIVRTSNAVHVLSDALVPLVAITGRNTVTIATPSPDGQRFVLADQQGSEIRRLDGTIERSLGQVLALAAHWDGARLVLGQTDGVLRVWDTTTWSEQHVRAHDRFITAITVSEAGLLATIGGDGNVHVWETDRRLQRLHSFSVRDTIAFAWWVGDRLLLAGPADTTTWDLSISVKHLDARIACQLPAHLVEDRIQTVEPSCD